MKTYSHFKSFSLGLVLVLLFTSSCEVERIENDIGATDLRSSARNADQVLTFKGKVYEASDQGICSNHYDRVPITKARLELPDYGLVASTNAEGSFTIKLPVSKLFEVHGKQALSSNHQFRFNVTKEGYIKSILTYDYSAFYEGEEHTGYVHNVLEIDFPLTVRNEAQVVTPEGGTFKFGNLAVTVPAGAVSENTSFSVTRLMHEQFKGKSNADIQYGIRATELERIDIYPHDLKFHHSISVALNTPGLTNEDKLEVTVLNEKGNLWIDDALNYKRSNTSTSFESNKGGTYRVTAFLANHSCEIFKDALQDHYQGEANFSNCDCSSASRIEFSPRKVLREKIEFGQDVSDELAMKIIHQIRRTANIPSAMYNCHRDGNTLSFYQVSCPIDLLLDQCETAQIICDQRTRYLKGKVFGVNILYRFSYTYDVSQNNGKCPTTSACHQGCHG